MPEIIDSASVTWSEASDELSATATGRVTGVTIDDDGTIGSASDTDAITIAANGDVTVSQDLVVSGGVFLGGTAAANLLDDYEEGTWTPVLADATTGGNLASPSLSDGFYNKVGNKVTVWFEIVNINTSGMTAANPLYVQDLPFVSSASGPNALVGYSLSDDVAISTKIVPFLQDGVSYFVFQEENQNAIQVQDLTSPTANFRGVINYFV